MVDEADENWYGVFLPTDDQHPIAVFAQRGFADACYPGTYTTIRPVRLRLLASLAPVEHAEPHE